uniref:Uncharacterized protein n=1 Tax=Amphimedon queenslandica TaxID=400682 RepID=A0A1X7SZ68_AMPQE
MSDPTQSCPSNFEEMNHSIRTCRKTEHDSGCSALTLPINDITYTQICGKVIGYQKGDTDAFLYRSNHNVIDSNYFDGVIITRGSEPREHVWSFISGKGSTTSSESDCPCNDGSAVQVPAFIKDHYYCESGNNDGTQIDNSKFYPDPLWDGENCPSAESPCCTSNNLPWFHRVYDASSSSDIELRVCRSGDRNNEDILIELYEIYIK